MLSVLSVARFGVFVQKPVPAIKIVDCADECANTLNSQNAELAKL